MPRRLTLVIHSLDGGGAERMLAMMANHWAEAGDHVTLITLAAATNDRYQLNPSVRRVALDLMKESHGRWTALLNNWRRIQALRRAIGDAAGDHVISFTAEMNILTLLACRSLAADVIACERVDPRHYDIGRLRGKLRRRVYPRCGALVVQTAPVRDWFATFARSAPIYVIPNAVQPTKLERRSRADHSQRILAVGRLAHQKGFDLLIEAFARLHVSHPDWQLTIVGDGPERESLERQVAERGMVEAVQLPGWSSDLDEHFATSDVFVLSSRYEGFPNALLEAMAAGLPVVSFDCDSGPGEIIRHEVDGLLVPLETDDMTSESPAVRLADAITRLITNDDERSRLGAAARDVVARFSEERFYEAWEAVFARKSPNTAEGD